MPAKRGVLPQRRREPRRQQQWPPKSLKNPASRQPVGWPETSRRKQQLFGSASGGSALGFHAGNASSHARSACGPPCRWSAAAWRQGDEQRRHHVWRHRRAARRARRRHWPAGRCRSQIGNQLVHFVDGNNHRRRANIRPDRTAPLRFRPAPPETRGSSPGHPPGPGTALTGFHRSFQITGAGTPAVVAARSINGLSRNFSAVSSGRPR